MQVSKYCGYLFGGAKLVASFAKVKTILLQNYNPHTNIEYNYFSNCNNYKTLFAYLDTDAVSDKNNSIFFLVTQKINGNYMSDTFQ